MSYELKTNTAVRIAVGPLLNPTDGKTAETGLTVTALSVQLYKIANDGGAVTRTQFAPTASAGDNDMVLVTSSTDGMYDLELTAAQLNWLGNGRISFYDVDGFLFHYFDIHVVSANYWNNKYGSTIEKVNVTQWLTQACHAVSENGVPKVDVDQLIGTVLTETAAGYLAAAFKKLFDVETPVLVASDVMRGTDDANVVVPDAAGVAPTAAEIKTAIEAVGSHLALIKAQTDDLADGERLDLLIDAIKAKTDNQPAGIPKNVALNNFESLMVLGSDHITPATGKTITAQISKDGGAFVACTNAGVEVGNGVYRIDLTQAEMNADIITLKFTETDCDQRTITIKTSA